MCPDICHPLHHDILTETTGTKTQSTHQARPKRSRSSRKNDMSSLSFLVLTVRSLVNSWIAQRFLNTGSVGRKR